jgi:hypothetical protein
MTEAEWLACTDPQPMLGFLEDSGRRSERKLRLFGCACCRRVWQHMNRHTRRAVEAAERIADSAARQWERLWYKVTTWPEGVWTDGGTAGCTSSPYGPARFAANALVSRRCDHQDAFDAVLGAVFLGDAEWSGQAHLLCDIFGNPFRPVTVSPAWQTPQVVSLAQAAYDQRELPTGRLDPARLAVLADALEEAGCTDGDLLGHLRGPGPHLRGCWAVDLILGKG